VDEIGEVRARIHQPEDDFDELVAVEGVETGAVAFGRCRRRSRAALACKPRSIRSFLAMVRGCRP
jgi:hypothetical protein